MFVIYTTGKNFATRIHITVNVPCLQAHYNFEVSVFTEINLLL